MSIYERTELYIIYYSYVEFTIKRNNYISDVAKNFRWR